MIRTTSNPHPLSVLLQHPVQLIIVHEVDNRTFLTLNYPGYQSDPELDRQKFVLIALKIGTVRLSQKPRALHLALEPVIYPPTLPYVRNNFTFLVLSKVFRAFTKKSKHFSPDLYTRAFCQVFPRFSPP